MGRMTWKQKSYNIPIGGKDDMNKDGKDDTYNMLKIVVWTTYNIL